MADSTPHRAVAKWIGLMTVYYLQLNLRRSSSFGVSDPISGKALNPVISVAGPIFTLGICSKNCQ